MPTECPLRKKKKKSFYELRGIKSVLGGHPSVRRGPEVQAIRWKEGVLVYR